MTFFDLTAICSDSRYQLLSGVAGQSLFRPYDREPGRMALKRLQDEAEDFVVQLLTPDPTDE